MLTLRKRRPTLQPTGSALEIARRELADLAAAETWLSYTTLGDGAQPLGYIIELRFNAPRAVSRDGAPICANVFRLEINMKPGYPNEAPSCRVASGSPIPFHPHFTAGRFLRRSRWIDYGRPAAERLRDFILRIAKSISYEAAAVNPSAAQIANPRALRWYSLARLKHPEWFPFREASRGHNPPTPQRTFTIMTGTEPARATRKTFEIVATSPPYEPASHPLAPALRALRPASTSSATAEHTYRLYLLRSAFA